MIGNAMPLFSNSLVIQLQASRKRYGGGRSRPLNGPNHGIWGLPWSKCLCPLQVPMLRSNLQDDGIRRWGLWVVHK